MLSLTLRWSEEQVYSRHPTCRMKNWLSVCSMMSSSLLLFTGTTGYLGVLKSTSFCQISQLAFSKNSAVFGQTDFFLAQAKRYTLLLPRGVVSCAVRCLMAALPCLSLPCFYPAPKLQMGHAARTRGKSLTSRLHSNHLFCAPPFLGYRCLPWSLSDSTLCDHSI